MHDWILTSWTAVVAVVVSTIAIYAWIIFVTRLYGLRSYSKISSFDFAMTVAIGTIAGTTLLTRDPPLLQGVVALGAVFALRWLVSVTRTRWPLATRILDNRPILLMKDGVLLSHNLRRVHVTEGEVREMLRESNVKDRSRVRALILERAGDFSVVQGEGPLDDWIFDDVEGWRHLD